jgi:hypothetical protein
MQDLKTVLKTAESGLF